MRFFTCDCDIATARRACGSALTGHAAPLSPVPGALPWAEMLFPLRGRNSRSRNIDTRRRGLFVPSARRGSWPDAPGEVGGGRSEVAGSIPTRRASFDFAPLGRRPKGAVTNQPRATHWGHAKQPRPCPERAKQNAVFHVRLRHRNSRDLWRCHRACGFPWESRFPRALPWAENVVSPSGGEIPDHATSIRGVEGINISRSFHHACGSHINRTHSSEVGGGRSEVAGSIPTRRASSDVAPLGRRPKGAVTNQPRATPWEHFHREHPGPVRAKQNAVFHVRLRHRNSRDLWRPYRACASLESPFPGRCPGLKCCFPFGAKFQITQHRYAASRGLTFPVPSARAGPTPTGRASEGIGGGRSRGRGLHTNPTH